MRARNIKPAFFKNEILAECDPRARVLFAGLWCYADREGRFEWRPKRIKVELLPYDNCDIDFLLKQLLDRGFIVKYNVNSAKYGSIPNFLRHQNPHCKETPSKIPAPEMYSGCTVQEQEKHTKDHVDSLIPDSGFSDSLIPDKKEPESGDSLTNQACPFEQIKDLWNTKTGKFPKILKLSKSRKTHLISRWKENPNLSWWENLFIQMAKIPFLEGQNDRGWVATFDWIIANDNNAVKVLEGNYPNARASPTGSKAERERRAIMTFDQEQK
jgi:hypothetical protein